MNGSSWQIVPLNAFTGFVLFALFFYLFFRHMLFVFMFADILFGWLRKFNWFPKEGKRLKTFVHWIIAVGLFVAFLVVAGSVGWLEFVPK